MSNKLFYGDNLQVLRESIKEDSIDLIYLDPPFNSNASYNILFKSPGGKDSSAQIDAFDDTWRWNNFAELAFDEVMSSNNSDASIVLNAMRSALGENDMMAYLAMMTPRLIALHRVLKETGTIFLHCDANASAYLRIIMDAIFGPENFRNEIHWYYYNKMHDSRKKLLPKATDTILFYVKNVKSNFAFKTLMEKREKPVKQLKRIKVSGKMINAKNEDGKVIYTMKEDRTIDNVWRIPMLQPASPERLGYPTQKPQKLLERIIEMACPPGGLILDPFCGCGTTIHAAQKMGHPWIGIDITHLSIGLVERRLREAFPSITFEVHGVPKDHEGAKDLALRDKYEFQKWITGAIGAQPYKGGRKGMDRGIDGYLHFRDEENKPQFGIISVKGGGIKSGDIRDLKGTIEREKAALGVFLTLNEPTKEMVREAAAAGFYDTGGMKIPKIQILTAEQVLDNRRPLVPFGFTEGYKKAKAEDDNFQTSLL